MLINALKVYDGTYVLVSHDRYFIQNTANKIWEIEHGKIRQFDGSYDEWEEFKRRREKEAQQLKNKAKASKEVVEKKPDPEEVKTEPVLASKSVSSEFKEKQKEEKRIRTKFTKVEEELAALNDEKKLLEAQLADPTIYLNKEQFQTTENKYNAVVLSINNRQADYELLFEQLMQYEN